MGVDAPGVMTTLTLHDGRVLATVEPAARVRAQIAFGGRLTLAVSCGYVFADATDVASVHGEDEG